MKKKKFIVNSKITIREAIRTMDKNNYDFLLIENEENDIIGIFTSGDLRSLILSGIDIEYSIEKHVNKKFIHLDANYTNTQVKKIFNNSSVAFIPILKKKKFINILKREKFIKSKIKNNLIPKNTSCIIFAGGKGTRLKPYTSVLPKPLIPYDNEPMIMKIIKNFKKNNVNNFYAIINEKKELIKTFFSIIKTNFKINFINETKPLGTAGGLFFIKNKVSKDFFISNCDVFLSANYSEILSFHKNLKNTLTIVGAIKDYSIEYGVCKLDEKGYFVDIEEKPKKNFIVNTGFYVANKKIFNFITRDKKIDMDTLIKKIKSKGEKVSVYPISEKSWQEIGNLKTFFSSEAQ
jgi:dTDP-glucose pyrophosphorylase